MYKTFTAEEYKKLFSLPEDYNVEGLLSYGGWKEEEKRDEIKQILVNNKIPHVIKTLDGFLSRVMEIKINNKNYWFVVEYGGAGLYEVVHLASLFGSKKNIHVGSCGGLSTEVSSLDIIIPTFSYGNESTTRMYDKEAKDFRHFPDEKLSNLLEKYIDHKYNIKKGPIITNQAMLGESLEDIKD